MEKKDKMNEKAGMFVMMALPGVNLFMPFMVADLKRDEYKEIIDGKIAELKDKVYEDEKSLHKYLEEMLME